MKLLLKVWNFLNGKKTFLGLLFYFLIGGFKQLGYLDEATANQLTLYANGLVGVGILHKLTKAL